ncbi:MAG: phosphoribosylaminoimidazole-succinocarboxamide synthase [Gammaproteobacteria bacterium]|jgi:phosphoribosylaminoimidazole-succinocarboxamide synthase
MSAPEHTAVFESHLDSLNLLARGKVRDIYEIDTEHLLFVASDRLSAFDVVLPDPIPGKGRVLTEVSTFWFAKLADMVENHLATDLSLSHVLAEEELKSIRYQAQIVKRLRPLPVEAIVRGYLIGSGWKDYQSSGSVSGIKLAVGLEQAEELPEVIFTPSTKAQVGIHDENISFDDMVQEVGGEVAEQVREVSIRIYARAREYALTRGIIIADTKFEFGLDDAGKVILIDEVLTPDSSRFWPADEYRVGMSPPSFDKQFVRDYLEQVKWNKAPPAPKLPAEIIARTAAKYDDARRRLIGSKTQG